MHKPTKAKWRAFKCRNDIHRFVDEMFIKKYNGYAAACKDCGKLNDKKNLYVNGQLVIRDRNLNMTFADNQ